MHRRRLIIEGRVQRVGYRAFAQRAARLLRVNGWVRNRSDGSVELVAEGDESSLASLVKSLNKGPRAAIVTKVDAVTGSTEETFSDFEIRPTVNMEDNQE
ncbi:MAG: acylphosphatase [Verrucomicrobia bacterium]|nr:acylphosphatase [Verrucomicrobiota bacterium]